MDETLAPGSGPSSGTFVPETPWPRRNNPLYAASALCILLGVYLASRDLEGSVGGRIAFAGVLEVYAGLLIAGATWLVRLGQTRSAGTLALLSVFFLVDSTLRVEGMVTTDQLAVPLLAAWAALAVLKLWLIGVPYGIELRLLTHLPALVVVIATVAIPHWVRSVPSQHAIAATLSMWLGAALIAGANAHVPRLSAPSGLERALRALPWLFAGGYHYHLFVTLYAYDVEFGMVQLVPYLALLPLFASSPKACLARSLAVVAFAATVASALSPMALAVCAILAIRGMRERAPSLQAAGVIAGLLGAWSWGAVRYPLRPILPEGTLRTRWDWALIVVALGFVALGAGFAVDYVRSRRRSPAKAESWSVVALPALANALLIAVALALGFFTATALSRKRPELTLDNALAHEPRLYAPLVLITIPIADNIALRAREDWLWALPVAVQYHLSAIHWGTAFVVLAFVSALTTGVAFHTRHAERWKLPIAGVTVLATVQLAQHEYTAPIAHLLVHTETPDGVILQSHGASCSAASGANIVRLLGGDATERRMAELYGTSDGTSPAQVIYGMRALGVECRGVSLQEKPIARLHALAMLFMQSAMPGHPAHATVYAGRDAGGVEIWDPLRGRERRTVAEVASARGFALECRWLSSRAKS